MHQSKEEKPKIEAIYPLSTMQQGVLFHHLTIDDDQGFLNVQCTIDGELNIEVLKKSWDFAIKRHPVLRTSVHWKKIKSPVQIVKPNGTMQWSYFDWTTDEDDIQSKKLINFKAENKKAGINFEKNPLSNISLVKTKVDSYYLVWCCHHLLLDGWSTSIILKDVFAYYDAFLKNETPNFETIPSYKSYLNYLKQIDVDEAKTFWNNTFKDFVKPFLLNQQQLKTNSFVKNKTSLPTESVNKVKAITKQLHITANTLFQGIWAIILSKYSNSEDITFGNTVSGRSGNFPNIDLMSGMFTNVLPLRTKLQDETNIKEWFKSIQEQQIKARKFEHFSISEITEFIQSKSPVIFDSLFIFENYPWEDINAGQLKVHSSQSSITTTYPLTVIIKAEEDIDVHLISDSAIFTEDTIHWILNSFEKILDILSSNKEVNNKLLIEKIPSIEINLNQKLPSKKNGEIVRETPKNKTELELLKIWEKLLNKSNISTRDNFFEIGGKSLLVIKMFTLIEKKLKVKISPITLLEYPTIETLSKFILNDRDEETWKYTVPLRAHGSKKPLFCIHGGGGFVFFFNPIANAVDEDRPVYAIQPSTSLHKNIQEMAKDYAKEIREIQPNGPYNLLVYCFSPAVGIEIANIYDELNEQTNLIVIDSIIKQEDFTDPERMKMRISGFLKRLANNPLKAVKLMYLNNFDKLIKPQLKRFFGSSTEKKLTKVKQNLVNIYKAYEWDKKHPGKTTLILTDKPDKNLNPTYIEAWEGITEQEVNILKTEGLHYQLFQSPYADKMATQIEKAIIENN